MSNCSGTDVQEEAAAEGVLVELAYELGLPLVATNDVRFAKPEQHAVHDVLMCIANSAYVSQADRPRASPQQYLKSPAEMMAAFSDLPEALESTVEIAKRCAFRPTKHKPILPPFDTKRGRDEAAELKAQAEAGLKERLKIVQPAAELSVYEERLDYELGIIERMGFPGYFLIVVGLHQVGEGARHSGRAGPGFGRRFAGRVGADHHRPRSDPVRPAVRALPQSGAGLDARLRRRLLPGATRRSDRVRAREVWRRSRVADHHVRHAAGARRAARCRARAAAAVPSGRQAGQAGAVQSGQAADAG